MTIRAYLRKLAGRAGKASHSKRGAHSHVNTKRNKQASQKAVRVSRRVKCIREMDTFAEDHHLDLLNDEEYHL
jgi:hypothetical protein